MDLADLREQRAALAVKIAWHAAQNAFSILGETPNTWWPGGGRRTGEEKNGDDKMAASLLADFALQYGPVPAEAIYRYGSAASVHMLDAAAFADQPLATRAAYELFAEVLVAADRALALEIVMRERDAQANAGPVLAAALLGPIEDTTLEQVDDPLATVKGLELRTITGGVDVDVARQLDAVAQKPAETEEGSGAAADATVGVDLSADGATADLGSGATADEASTVSADLADGAADAAEADQSEGAGVAVVSQGHSADEPKEDLRDLNEAAPVKVATEDTAQMMAASAVAKATRRSRRA